MTNWPVRWKVFAIVLVPLILAGAFGGLRIYSDSTERADLRRAADRAEIVPAIESYMAALEGAMLANSTGGDTQSALAPSTPAGRTCSAGWPTPTSHPDVRKGVTTLLDGGQALLDQVTVQQHRPASTGSPPTRRSC